MLLAPASLRPQRNCGHAMRRFTERYVLEFDIGGSDGEAAEGLEELGVDGLVVLDGFEEGDVDNLVVLDADHDVALVFE